MERRFTASWIAAAICTLATGCDPELQTEEHQVRMTTRLQSYGLGSGHAVVEQSTVCTTFTGYRASSVEPPEYVEAEDEELRACYESRLSGAASLDEAGCVVLDEPGAVTWELVRRQCSLDGDFGDDRVLFDVLPLSATRGVFDLAIPGPTEVLGYEVIQDLPAGYVVDPDATLRVIEDGLEAIETAVARDDRLERVAVSDARATAVAIEGSPSFPAADEPSTSLRVQARAGDAFQVGLSLPAGELDVGRVEVVARSEIASISLEPVVVRVADTDVFLALGAVAITRDADGGILRGAPVEWAVVEGDEGPSLADRDEDGAPDLGEEASIEGACDGAAAGETRSLTLSGRLDDFQDTIRVEWDCVGAQDEDADGCACRSRGTSPGSGLAGWLGLGLLGAWRRRRRRAARS